MLYQEYKAKLDKRKHAFERLWKFRLLILAAVILLVAASGALLGVKGIVYDFSIPISTLQYGQSFSAFADCVFGEASFEFRAEGERQWTTQCPIYAGKYECRAVGKTSVGTMRPGEIQSFEILPISVDVTVYGKDPGDQPPKYYGDELVFYAQLPYGDELQVKNYTYERQEDEIVVSIDKADVVAVNSDGKDVTSSYAFDSQTLPVEQRPITVTMPSQTFEYDGQPHQTQGAEADEGLLPKHHLEVVAADSFTEAGNYTNSFGTLKIVDDKGNDMTSMYDVTRHDGKVNVAKREISVTTGSLPITYDGASHNAASFEITSEKQLAAGQTLQLTYDSFTAAGRYPNEPATVKVATEDGTDVTSNYAITWKYGTVDIAKRPLRIEPVGDSWGWVYDAQPHLDDGSFQVVYDSAYPQLDGQEVHFNYTSPVNAGSYMAHRREAGQESGTGEFAFSVTITLDGKDETANFDISDNVSEKTFTVQRRHVEVQLGSITAEYDGTFYQNNSVTFANDTQMVSGQSLSVECKQYRDANEYQNELESETSYTIQTAEGEVVDPANYDIKWLPGAVTINKLHVAVQLGSFVTYYSGAFYQENSYTFADDTKMASEQALYVTCKQYRDADEYQNVLENDTSYEIRTDADEVVNPANYDIEWLPGTITILKLQITVQLSSFTTEYDGAFHQSNSFTLPYGTMASGETLSVTCKQYKDADEYPNELESATSYTIQTAEGEVVSPANYNIEWVKGTVTITKRPLTVITDSGTHEYDGESFNVPTATVQNLVSGHTYQLTPTTSTVPTFTNATPATENRFEFTLDVYDGEENVTKNYYNDSTSYGTIEITPRDVVLTVGSGTFVYNAEPQSVKKITGDRLLDGHRVEAEYPSFTYANTYRNDITGECRIFAGEIDVTENYNIQSIQTGTVEITKRPLTIQPVGDSWGWVYDAQTHLSDSNFQVIYDSQYPQLDNQEVHFNYTSPVNAGDYTTYMRAVGQEDVTDELAFSVEVEITIKGINETNNFEIRDNVSQKTFTIQKRPVEVQTGSENFVYNGLPRRFENFKVDETKGLVRGHSLDVEFPSWTDASTYSNEPTSCKVTALDGGDVTGNYDIKWEYGTVTIDPCSISVATRDLEYFYIGKPIDPSILSNIEDIVYCTKGQLQNQDRFSLSYESDIVNVGNEYQNQPTIAIVNSDGDDKTSNYTIQNPDTWGTITVKQRVVDAQVYDIPLEYNGMYQGYMSVFPTTYDSTEEGSGIVAGQVLVVHNSAQLKDCGSIKLELTWSVTTVNGVDASDNYHVNIIYEGEGVLTITKRYIRFSTESDNKLYDGKPLSNKGVTATAGLVEGHKIEYEITSELPSLTDVGHKLNEFAFTATITDENGVTVTDNYDVESAYYDVLYGMLTVSERAVTLTTASATLTYDAKPHTFDTIEGELASGHSVKATFYSFTDANTYFNLPEDGWKIVDDEGNVIYDSANGASTNYIITWEYGTVTIDPCPITVATGSEMGIEYDGKPHSAENFTVQSKNFLETYGHTLVVTYYCSFEEVNVNNKNNNSVSDEWWNIKDGSGNDVTSNYEVTWEWGTVQIVPRKITVKTADITQVYDGTMYPKNDSSTPQPKVVSQTQLVEGQTLSVVYKQNRVVGNYKTEPSSYSITKSDGAIVTYNYDIVWDYGTTTINKCPITVKLKDDVQLAWTYDAQCHVTSDSFVVDSSTPLPANHTLAVTVKSFTNAGEYKAGEGDFEYQIDITFHGLSRPTIVSNFEITDEVKGTEVTISKRPFKFTTGSATWVYGDYQPSEAYDYNVEWFDGDSNRGMLRSHFIWELNYTYLDSITDSDTEVKYVDNKITGLKIVYFGNDDYIDVSDNYIIEEQWGKLRVKSPIVVRVYSFKKTYDGKEISLTAENYRIEKLPPDIRESDVTLNLGYSMTRVGTVTLADFKQYNFEKENYHATCEDGIWDLSFYGQDNLIEITPRRITVRSDTRSVQWTGGALYGRDYGYTFSTLAEGDSIDFVDITGVLLPDELEAVNTIGAISIVNAKGENVTDCYQIDIKEGTLRWRNPPQNEQFALSNLVLTEQADPFSRKFGEN